jgi:PAS domain S-box-containing protein
LPDEGSEIRARAEASVAASETARPDDLPEPVRHLVHELRVHQIELELQNEELHRAQAALEASRERYLDLYERAPVGYFTLDEAGVVVEANLTFVAMLGLPRERVLGRPLTAFVVAADQDTLYLHRKRLEESSAPRVCELRLTRGDRPPFWARLETSGRAAASRTAASDISERKRLEAKLAQVDRLASMGLLAASIAHEINNPLAYVSANLDSLGEELGKLGSDALDLVELVGDAVDGVRRITKIARSLRIFTRLDEAERVQVDVNATLEWALRLVRTEAEFRATLVVELGTVPAVVGSSGRLSQVFLNLLMNAAHAIPEGHPDAHRIEVRSWSEDDWVVVEIGDTGHGIPLEIRDRIFEPFFTTEEIGVGSGLGLAIVKTVVDELGGTVTVSSDVGVGSRFRVRLPVPDAPHLVRAPRSPGRRPSERGRILVVDDEPGIRKMLVRWLSGHEVVTDVSAVEARQRLEIDRGFDVILCDLMMADVSGIGLHAWLTSVEPALAARMVFMTGGGFTPEAAHFIETVNNVCLEKPFERAVLDGVLAAQLAMARQARKH